MHRPSGSPRTRPPERPLRRGSARAGACALRAEVTFAPSTSSHDVGHAPTSEFASFSGPAVNQSVRGRALKSSRALRPDVRVEVTHGEPFMRPHQPVGPRLLTRALAGDGRGSRASGPGSAGVCASWSARADLGGAAAESTRDVVGASSRGRSCSPERRAGREHGAVFNGGR